MAPNSNFFILSLRGGLLVAAPYCMNHKLLSAAMRANTTHGEARRGKHTPEYDTWVSMRDRCVSPSHASYEYYGGRGIAVCARWDTSYEAFLADMGRRPTPQHSIDRIDNDGDYEPLNCRWATKAEQMANRRRRCNAAPLAVVNHIRQLLTDGISTRKIAQLVGRSRSCVCHIKQGRSNKGEATHGVETY